MPEQPSVSDPREPHQCSTCGVEVLYDGWGGVHSTGPLYGYGEDECAFRASASRLPDYLTWAMLAAAHYHEGQVDKIGEPYIGHPARVAAAVRDAGFGHDVQAVAWLHDVVEDTELSLSALRLAVPASVANAVDAITKRHGEKFADYYERVKANPLALAVKWHDVADNADPRRLAKVAPDTRDRLRAKYERAKALLVGPTV